MVKSDNLSKICHKFSLGMEEEKGERKREKKRGKKKKAKGKEEPGVLSWIDIFGGIGDCQC